VDFWSYAIRAGSFCGQGVTANPSAEWLPVTEDSGQREPPRYISRGREDAYGGGALIWRFTAVGPANLAFRKCKDPDRQAADFGAD
jgi:hypothetical protein